LKQWIAEGGTGKVPALDDNMQPSELIAAELIAEEFETAGSKRGQQIGVDPAWKTSWAGGWAGGETGLKRWILQGSTGDVPDLDEDLQPRAGKKQSS